MHFFKIVLVVLFFSLVSCQNDSIFEVYKPLSVDGWDLHDTLDFKFEIKDISKYTIYILV